MHTRKSRKSETRRPKAERSPKPEIRTKPISCQKSSGAAEAMVFPGSLRTIWTIVLRKREKPFIVFFETYLNWRVFRRVKTLLLRRLKFGLKCTNIFQDENGINLDCRFRCGGIIDRM
jgi:hypothetical protein